LARGVINMIHKPTLISHMLQIIKDTNVLNDEDFRWCEFIINRNDQQDGIEQLTPLVDMCSHYLADRKDLSIWQDYSRQKEIANRIYTVKSLYYKQKRILLACPQRRKHPKIDVPNLGNLIAPQHVRLDVAAVYNLGYCESRQYFVDKALSENVYTHILFLDDDILLPLDAVSKLVEANADFISANYVKRNPLLESTATRLVPNDKLVWTQSIIEPTQGDYRILDANCVGLGAALVDVDVFRKVPAPFFEFRWEYNPDGSRKRLLVGEDSTFCQKAMMHGVMPKIIPGLSPVHVDFRTGKYYGPEWVVDPATRKIRPEYEERYCKIMVENTKELVAPDNDDTFTFNQMQ